MMGIVHAVDGLSDKVVGKGWHCPMMAGFSGMGSGWMWLGGAFWLITWVLVVAVLVALLRWLWKKGGK